MMEVYSLTGEWLGCDASLHTHGCSAPTPIHLQLACLSTVALCACVDKGHSSCSKDHRTRRGKVGVSPVVPCTHFLMGSPNPTLEQVHVSLCSFGGWGWGGQNIKNYVSMEFS